MLIIRELQIADAGCQGIQLNRRRYWVGRGYRNIHKIKSCLLDDPVYAANVMSGKYNALLLFLLVAACGCLLAATACLLLLCVNALQISYL